MKKVQSGQGATDVSAGIPHDQLMGRPASLPEPEPMNIWPGGGVLPTDPVLARRVDDLERRVLALENRE